MFKSTLYRDIMIVILFIRVSAHVHYLVFGLKISFVKAISMHMYFDLIL